MADRLHKMVRLPRSLGMSLTPEAKRYFEYRPYGPGEHGWAWRRSESDYAVRSKEKQRLRAQCVIREAQLVKSFQEALRMEGRIGDNLITLLEQRLGTLVLCAGFGRTMFQTRQIVTHRHILVDGKIVDRPSCRVRPGQAVQVKPSSQVKDPFVMAARGSHHDVLPAVPDYLSVDLEKLRFTLNRVPKRDEVPVQCDIQLVVEYYPR